MTHLACSSCGRGIAAVAPLAQLAGPERLCPRCGAPLRDERRISERRVCVRRQAQRSSGLHRERRHTERRAVQRRAAADPFRYNPLVDGRTRWQTVQRPYGEDQ